MTMDTAFRDNIMKFLESQAFSNEYLSRIPDSYSGIESFSAAKSRAAAALFNQPPPMTQAQIDAIMNSWVGHYERHWALPVEAPCTEWDIL